jgi:hypothetical protein
MYFFPRAIMANEIAGEAHKAPETTLPVARQSWIKPEIVSYEPVEASENLRGFAAGDGFNNQS